MSVESVFAEAIQKNSASERASFLNRACEGNVDMRAHVEALLHAHDNPDKFFDGPDAASLPTTVGPAVLEKAGSVIDRYKLLEQIGEGGFGVVFMAEQLQPVHRKVALKIIKPGMDTKEVIARFEAERQALALMDHPNIAKVLDAGSTDSGRPYFVMELVRGKPITEFCEEQGVQPRERLELFRQVCHAVQHAHQKGIIHRDLKPSNVLVTMHDDRPVPKVIDFGVAKATNARLTERTLFTRFAQIVGTPLYMSPEQTQMSGLDVDTRSDIYSLGVLLYELLTGTTPFDRKRLHEAAYEELLNIIREVDPPKPSTRVSTLGKTATFHKSPKANPHKLSQLLRGELDWIVMKALEKDRIRRYETASGLASDIERYLNNEPVKACPPSTVYRLRKLVSRYRIATSAVVAAFMALLAVLAGTMWHAEQIRQERDTNKALLSSLQDVLFDQGMTEILSGNHESARQSIQRLRANDAQELALQLDAFLLIQLGKSEEAINSLSPWVENAPNSVPYHALLAMAYDQSGDMEGAVGHGEKLKNVDRSSFQDKLFIALAPDSYQSELYPHLKLVADEYEQRRSPTLLLLLATRQASVAYETGNKKLANQALENIDAAKVILGTEVAVVRSLMLKTVLESTVALQHQVGDFDHRLQELDALVDEIERAQKKRPSHLENFWLANCYYFRGDVNKTLLIHKANASSSIAKAGNENDLASYYYLGLAAELGTDVDGEFLEQLRQNSPGVVTRYGLSLRALMNNRPDEALNYFKTPKTPWEVGNRLAILSAVGRFEDAKDEASKFTATEAEEQGDVFSSLFTKLIIPSIADHWEDEELLSQAQEFERSRIALAHAHFFLGLKALGQANNKEEAQRHFERCAELGIFYDGITHWARAFSNRVKHVGN